MILVISSADNVIKQNVKQVFYSVFSWDGTVPNTDYNNKKYNHKNI